MRIIKQWQEQTEDIVYDYRLIQGIKRQMKGHELARAIFGQFETCGQNVIHSTYNGDQTFGYDDEYSVSEFLDDMNWLREGNAQFVI